MIYISTGRSARGDFTDEMRVESYAVRRPTHPQRRAQHVVDACQHSTHGPLDDRSRVLGLEHDGVAEERRPLACSAGGRNQTPLGESEGAHAPAGLGSPATTV